jgi:hypothetical protein
MVTNKDLDNVKYYVGKAMTDFPCFRTHEHRDDLVSWVRAQGMLNCFQETAG